MASCKVIILAGGFEDAFYPQGPNQVSLPSSYPNRALAPLAGYKGIEYILRALSTSHRLSPIHESISIVVNRRDEHLYKRGDSIADWLEAAGLRSSNVICNGASTDSEWRGDLADLHTVLLAVGTDAPVLVIKPSFSVLPNFNFQRIIEHSLLRGREVIATREWSLIDSILVEGSSLASQDDGAAANWRAQFSSTFTFKTLYGSNFNLLNSCVGDRMLRSGQLEVGDWEGGEGGEAAAMRERMRAYDGVWATVDLQGGSTMPPVTEITFGPCPLPGDRVAEPILFLRPQTASKLLEAAFLTSEHGQPGSVVALASHLLESQQGQLHSTDLGLGFLPLAAWRNHHYSDMWLAYYLDHFKPPQLLSSDKGVLQENARQYTELLHDFQRLYSATQLSKHEDGRLKLPDTFYMTAYRRQAAEILR